jgi:chromosome segregation ATPase
MKHISLLAALLFATSLAHGEDKPSREQEQLRRLRAQTQQLQQALSAEQQARQAAATELQARKGDLDKLDAEAQAARRRAGSTQRQLEQTARELDETRVARDTLQKQLDDTRTLLGARETDLQQTRNTLQDTQRDLGATRARSEALAGRLGQCEQDNAALYRTGIEVLDHYRNRTLGDRVAQGEPFSQVGRVRLENLIDAYRDRLDERRSAAAQLP